MLSLLLLASAQSGCPSGMTTMETGLSFESKLWIACEDLSIPDGAVVLLAEDGSEEVDLTVL